MPETRYDFYQCSHRHRSQSAIIANAIYRPLLGFSGKSNFLSILSSYPHSNSLRAVRGCQFPDRDSGNRKMGEKLFPLFNSEKIMSVRKVLFDFSHTPVNLLQLS